MAVDGVHASTREYLAKFRDLLAEERKTFEFTGRTDGFGRRVWRIELYRFELGGEGKAAEYRHVLRVDGSGGKADLRSEEFLKS